MVIFSVYVHEQILLTEVTGPWNRELVDYWAEQAFVLAQQFSRERPYVAVTEVYESMLCPLMHLNVSVVLLHTRINIYLVLVSASLRHQVLKGEIWLSLCTKKIQFAQIF